MLRSARRRLNSPSRTRSRDPHNPSLCGGSAGFASLGRCQADLRVRPGATPTVQNRLAIAHPSIGDVAIGDFEIENPVAKNFVTVCLERGQPCTHLRRHVFQPQRHGLQSPGWEAQMKALILGTDTHSLAPRRPDRCLVSRNVIRRHRVRCDQRIGKIRRPPESRSVGTPEHRPGLDHQRALSANRVGARAWYEQRADRIEV
jgi:hypothetical protein